MKEKNKIRKIFFFVFVFLFFLLLFFLICTSYLKKHFKQSPFLNDMVLKKTEEDVSSKKNPLDIQEVDLDYYRKLYKNEEIVARLEIPNLFNLFITQSKDNLYYLNHSIYKKKDIRGNVFMDYRVNPSSKQINIYGHNSKTFDTPFRQLENYLNEEFYHDNPYIILQCDDGYRIYKIVAIKEILSDYEYMNVNITESEFVSHILKIKQDAIYETPASYNKDSNILILQTCSYHKNNAYYILMALEI